MSKFFRLAVILLIVVALLSIEADGWRRRRRRRRRVNCGYNNWTRWSTCNGRCRQGTQYRRRYIYRWPCCGGWGCPSTYSWRYCGRWNGGCQQRCTGNNYCSCYTGYWKSGTRCYDTNECARNPRPCNQICRNTVGSFTCSCYYGYYLATRTRCDRVSCGAPRVPNCPSSAYRDQFGTTCQKVYFPSCGNLYTDYCYPKCSSSNYALATYSGPGSYLQYYSYTKFEAITRVQCQGNRQWTDAGLLSRLYCRRVNDPPTSLSISSTAINEGTAVGTTVATFSTSDPQTSQSHVYTLRDGTANTGYYLFRISGNKLINRWVPALNVRGGIAQSSFQITVRTTDNGRPNMYKEQAFNIRVINVNDKPEDLKLTPWNVKEDVSIGTRVGYLTAYDRDLPSTTNPCASWILRDDDNGFFRLSGNAIYTAKSLNHEAQSFHSITVICVDKASSVYSTSATLVIDVQDAKDPPISVTIDNKKIDENSKVGALVGTATAIDEDDEDLQISLFPTSSVFDLTSTTCVDITSSDHIHRKSCTARLVVKSATLNWEQTSWYMLNIWARDTTPSHLHKVLSVNVTVNNLNEQPTGISVPTPTIQENSPGGSLVSDLDVSDPDNEVQLVQRPTCALAPSGDNSKFQIEGQSPNYDLALAKDTVVDYEKDKKFYITVTCNDHGLPPMSITRSFTITVQDENEAPTGISLSASAVKENVPIGYVVGSLSTTDPDTTPQTFTYKLLPRGGGGDLPFEIKGSKVVVNSSIDYETEEAYILSISSTDQGGLEFIGQIDLNVTDVPEGPTSVTLDGTHSFPENSDQGTLVGNIIVTDQDFNQLPTCAVQKDLSNNALTVGGTGGDELVVGTRMVDYESQGTKPLMITIRCTDSDGLYKDATFSVTVTNENEAPTNITLDKDTVPEHTAPYTVGQLTVEDPDAGQTHNCSVQDNPGSSAAGQIPETQYFKITKSNQLEVIKPLDYDNGLDTYSVHVLCSDIPTNPNQTSFVIERDLTVYVVNINEPPGSPCIGTNWEVSEAAASGTPVTNPLMANDTDPGQALSYQIVNSASVPFYINATNNIIQTSGGLDYEKVKLYDLQIKVTDDGTLSQVSGATTATPSSATFTCRINVLDANDPHASMDISLMPPNPCVDEHIAVGGTVATISTTDVDAGATFTYKISPSDGPLSISGNKIVANKVANETLDSEKGVTSVVITITSTDSHGISVSRPFTICVRPVNENATKMCLVGDTIKENVAGVATIGQIIVQDPDLPIRTCGPPPQPHTELPTNYTCSVNDDTSSQAYTTLFQVSPTLQLQLQKGKSLDFEARKTYQIPITCADKLATFNQISAVFNVKVLDVNEAPQNIRPNPTGQNQPYNATSTMITVTVPERTSGIVLLTLTSDDPDYPSSTPLVTYHASGDGIPNMMEMQNNQLVLLKPLDYETKKQYVLNVQVTDDGKPPPALTTTIKVIVNVQDTNDLPTRINLVCRTGAWFPFANSTQRPATSTGSSSMMMAPNMTVPSWPSNLIPFPGIFGSSDDCSRLSAGDFMPGDVIGEIYPEDQDSQKWYTFSLLGKDAHLFALYPFGTMYQQKYAHSALLLVNPAVNAFNFSYGNPTYDVYVDVFDNYGKEQIGHIIHIKTFDACYSKMSECLTPSTCMPSKTSIGQVNCACPVGSHGDGRRTAVGGTGCTACGAGELPDSQGNCNQVDECASKPCVHGTCSDGIFSFTCHCPVGFTGTMCETNLGACYTNPGICQNGGTCVDGQGLGALSCTCPTGYSGKHCEFFEAACSDFPASCQDGAKYCALTPHVGQLESTPLCVHNIDLIHVILTGVPQNAVVTQSAFYYAVSGYIDEILADPNFGLTFNTFASHQLGQSSSGSRSRRSATYTKLSDKPYLTQVLNVTALRAGMVLASATVLVAANQYKMASGAYICPKLDTINDIRCAGVNDCAIIESIHFRCSPLPLSAQPTHIQSDTIAYVQTYDKGSETVNTPPCNANRACNAGPTKEFQGAGPTESTPDPFYKTVPGIVVMCVGAVGLIVILVAIFYFRSKRTSIKSRYEDRRLMEDDTISTISGQSSGLQTHTAGRFSGVRNPLFDGGDDQPTVTREVVQNETYESAEPTQVVENEVYDSSDTAALYEELPQ